MPSVLLSRTQTPTSVFVTSTMLVMDTSALQIYIALAVTMKPWEGQCVPVNRDMKELDMTASLYCQQQVSVCNAIFLIFLITNKDSQAQSRKTR